MVTMLLILTLDVKLQMLIINKNIYSVLKKKFNVQREVECSFLISVGGESNLFSFFLFCAFQGKASRVTQTDLLNIFFACPLDSSYCTLWK